MLDAPSLLSARSDRLAPYVGVALIGHLLVLGGLVALEVLLPNEPPPKPLIDVSMTIEAYDAMPKSDRLPQRATRVATPRGAETPTTSSEPVPPVQSDMALKDPNVKPDPKQAGTDDPNRKVDDAAARRRLLEDLDADAGPVDRDAASPDGMVGGKGLDNLGRGDPEFARYSAEISRLFREDFRPLPTLTGKGLKTIVLVRVDAEWNVTERKLKTGSGNAYWDRAAVAAAGAVTKVPPPPEKYRDAFLTHGYDLTFEDP